MAFDIKKTASQLLKIADTIEKEAYEKTYFVCDVCNHTANLASINATRAKIASEDGIGSVKPVTVNDKVRCAAAGCDGIMSYAATDESAKYYVDVEAGKEEDDPFSIDLKEEEETETPVAKKPSPLEDKPSKGQAGPEEDESPFESVDEQDKEEPEEGEEELIEEEVPAESLESPPEGPEGTPEAPPKEEEPMAEKKPKKRKKKDKSDDEKAVPKFTEMPEDMKDINLKTASDRFIRSVARYSNI